MYNYADTHPYYLPTYTHIPPPVSHTHSPTPTPRMRLCFSVTEAEVERAKNVFKTSLFMHLDGQCANHDSYIHALIHVYSRVLSRAAQQFFNVAFGGPMCSSLCNVACGSALILY